MARETKMEKVYPSDEAVRYTVDVYESFGWEVVGNQKITDNTGGYEGADGNYYTTTETYIQLTFSREKSSPWYAKVRELETQYYEWENKAIQHENTRPEKPKIGFGWILTFTPLFPLGIFFIVSFFAKKKKYNSEIAGWLLKNDAVQANAKKDMARLKEEARALVEA